LAERGEVAPLVMTVAGSMLDIDPATYRRHPLHDDDRDWPETNCYVDLWIELLHALGLDPVAALAFTLSCGFDGEQWEFFKYPLEDLRALYGLEVHELNAWRSLEVHIEEHLRLGHLLTVEADSWYLPDTAGVSYGIAHQKSSLVPAMIDPASTRLGYFHNRGYHVLDGDDYHGALRTAADPSVMPPYTELIDLERVRRPDDDTLRSAVGVLVAEHLARRPRTNPVEGLGSRIVDDVSWLRESDQDLFHAYAFGTLRQCGAWAACAASFVEWFDPRLQSSIEAFNALSSDAKTAQFKLARVAAGRDADLGPLFRSMAEHWDEGYRELLERHG
jgi:hypothetical protein